MESVEDVRTGSKSFGDLDVLHGVTFTLSAGGYRLMAPRAAVRQRSSSAAGARRGMPASDGYAPGRSRRCFRRSACER
ncbi:MAG: hypothetical protein ACLU0O_09475 [Collinsella sp.]